MVFNDPKTHKHNGLMMTGGVWAGLGGKVREGKGPDRGMVIDGGDGDDSSGGGSGSGSGDKAVFCIVAAAAVVVVVVVE